MKTDNFIAVSEVTKSFGGFLDRRKVRALDHVSFSARRAEVQGLIGPSDSGKSTMLKLLAGSLDPDQGSIILAGVSLRNSPMAAQVGYLPSGFNLDPRLPCANVLFDLAGGLGLTPAQCLKRTQELFEFIGASEAIHHAFGELAAVTQRSICIGRAVALDFEILLLDDPLAGLDPDADRVVKRLIRKLAQSGKTVLLASRWLADAVGTCDRAIILGDGKVQARGTFAEIFDVPGALSVLGPLLSPAVRHKAVEAIWQELVLAGGSNHMETTQPRLEPIPYPEEAACQIISEEQLMTSEHKSNVDKLAALAAKAPTPLPAQMPSPAQPAADELMRANEKLAALLAGRGGSSD